METFWFIKDLFTLKIILSEEQYLYRVQSAECRVHRVVQIPNKPSSD